MGMLLLVGCGARKEYQVDALEITQTSWDTLAVNVSFVQRTTLGAAKPIMPEDIHWLALDAVYDTVYSGGGPDIVINDANLGNRERVMIEVCGRFGTLHVCEQEGVIASPKRVRVKSEIEYPLRAQYAEGTYELYVQVERQQFGATTWETIWPDVPPQAHMRTYVAQTSDGIIEWPIQGKKGRFNLARLPNHNDFNYHLLSSLQDHQEAKVRFEVFAQLRSEPMLVATVDRVIRRKTEAERAYEVAFFADQAARWILSKLGVTVPIQNVFAYIDEWAFEEQEATYAINLEIVWRSNRRFARKYVMYGQLRVAETGFPAQFTCTRCNRYADRLWRRNHDSDVLALDSLQVVPVAETTELVQR